MPHHDDTPAVATRRRDDELLDAIHEAVFAELAEHGFHGVTFEGVARRARTSKPVLYRRFTSRAELVAAAVLSKEPFPAAPNTTGNLRDDLLAFFDLHERRFERLGASVVRGLLSELDQDRTEVFLGAALEEIIPLLRSIIAEASARGELGRELVPDDVVTAPIGIIRYEFLTLGKVPERHKVERLLDLVYLPLLRLHSGAEA